MFSYQRNTVTDGQTYRETNGQMGGAAFAVCRRA